MTFWSHMKGILVGRMPDQHEYACHSWKFSRHCPPAVLSALQSATCPECGDPVLERGIGDLDNNSVVNHHLKVLGDFSEIRQARREIRRIYPEFEEHPVFDDLKPIVYGRRHKRNVFIQ